MRMLRKRFLHDDAHFLFFIYKVFIPLGPECQKERKVAYTCYDNTRDVFYVRRKEDLMKTAKVNAYIMHIFGKIELLSIHAT